jgi:hypothetical protein
MNELYRSIMDSDQNPLNTLPPAQRFQVMVVLSLMWTSIFCTAASVWFWYGELIAVHILLALGVSITGMTFRASPKGATYRDHPKTDGTARYDDVWGA